MKGETPTLPPEEGRFSPEWGGYEGGETIKKPL